MSTVREVDELLLGEGDGEDAEGARSLLDETTELDRLAGRGEPLGVVERGGEALGCCAEADLLVRRCDSPLAFKSISFIPTPAAPPP